MELGYIFLSEFSTQSDIILRAVFGRPDDPMSGTRGLRRGAIPDKSDIWTRASTPHTRRGTSVARNIFVEELVHTPIEEQGDEIVERKGIGHPDSIADGLAETVSVALCKMYQERFGRILHHNTDQVEVVGGQSAPKFGGGVFLEPAYILLVGRATTMVDGVRLPYRTAAIQAAHDYLTKTCTNLTVAAAFVDKYVPDKDHYRSVKEELRERLLDNAVKYTDRSVKVDINTGDNLDSEIYYLTVTGLSWENGDDGSVGRGNRVSGLITPYRPMSMEAAAGKNPVTHVGKLYNLLSFDIADRLVKEQAGKVREVWVRIVSQIGKPIDQPQAATAQIIPEKGTNLKAIEKDAAALIDEELENIYKLTDRIVAGKVRTF